MYCTRYSCRCLFICSCLQYFLCCIRFFYLVQRQNVWLLLSAVGTQTVRFKNELERNITIKLGYANAKIFKAVEGAVPGPGNFRRESDSTSPPPIVPSTRSRIFPSRTPPQQREVYPRWVVNVFDGVDVVPVVMSPPARWARGDLCP